MSTIGILESHMNLFERLKINTILSRNRDMNSGKNNTYQCFHNNTKILFSIK